MNRNDNCKCGSGRKFKKCCLKNEWQKDYDKFAAFEKWKADIKADAKRDKSHLVTRPAPYLNVLLAAAMLSR